ncbi:MAG: zinc-binding dehydrogenase, partial [Candidatus Micrarchaeaceae archaeon]
EKKASAKSYGATGVLISSSREDMEQAANTFDFLLDTIPMAHDVTLYLHLLAIHGTVCLVGPIEPMPGFHSGNLIHGQRSVAGSGIGGIQETKEMLAFSTEHRIMPEIEVIPIEEINRAWDALVSKQTAKRYVIDMKQSFRVV